MPVEMSGDFEGLLQTIREEAATKLKEVADVTASRAQELCPYDENKQPTASNPSATHLRDTIAASEVVDAGDSISVAVTAGDPEAGVDYSQFVELGTVRMAAQPFLGPSYEEGRALLEDSLGQIIT